jgi:two-component system, OmpR family, sensor histidine kinase KdpD
VATAVERVHFLTVAQDTLLSMESEKLRNSLLAALSHDLRTPLTALVGTSQNLSQALQREGSAHATDAQTITEQAQRTTQLVNNLLDMARLQAGNVTLRLDWQSLEELAGSALRSVESALAGHPVRIQLPGDLPLLHADGVLIERVLANLFENAAKYTPAGTPITLSARLEGAQVLIDVSDTGLGLPAQADAETLFQKFSRGDRESSTPGVGLGLAICRAIVQAHGGRISGFNRTPPEHGAVLRFTLPHREMPALAGDGDDADPPAQ